MNGYREGFYPWEKGGAQQWGGSMTLTICEVCPGRTKDQQRLEGGQSQDTGREEPGEVPQKVSQRITECRRGKEAQSQGMGSEDKSK